MANCYRGPNSFRIRDILQNANPLSTNRDIQVYETASIPDFNSDALIYFAMSVIWRAAVHEWSVNGEPYQIELGPYEERVRAFLLGRSLFPDRVALITRVSSHPTMLEIAYLPQHANKNGYQLFKFGIPGVVFMALVGGKIPQRDLSVSTSPAPQRYVSIYPKIEMRELFDLAEFVQRGE